MLQMSDTGKQDKTYREIEQNIQETGTKKQGAEQTYRVAKVSIFF